MRTHKQLLDRLEQYGAADHIYDGKVGYIAWHFSTGDNVEVLFIEAAEKRKGYGTEMYRRMCQRLIGQGKRPYHSVFGFRLASNSDAAEFYAAMGWTEQLLVGKMTDEGYAGLTIYGGEPTVIFWISWSDLLKRLGIDRKGDVP